MMILLQSQINGHLNQLNSCTVIYLLDILFLGIPQTNLRKVALFLFPNF